MIFAVYKLDDGEIVRSINIPDFLADTIELGVDEGKVEIYRNANDATEYIKDGVLTPKPIADQPS